MKARVEGTVGSFGAERTLWGGWDDLDAACELTSGLGVLEIVGQGGGRWRSLGANRTLWGGGWA